MKDGNNNENQNKESVSADIGFVLEPINLSSEKLELCNKLDKFYKNYIYINYKGQKPFDLIYGIYYAMRSECRSNLDWKSQAAHSARELVYPFLSRISKGNLLKLFRKYSKQIREKENIKTENRVFVKTLDNLREDYKELQDLAHHLIRPTSSRFKKNILNFSDNDFEKLIERFFLNLKKTLRFQQIFIHNIIDFIIQEKGKKRINRVKKDLKLVLGINNDAKNYFFSQATAKWLDMLWNNGFLDKIKQESKDPTQYSYGLIELNYITKVSEEASAKVT